MTYLPCLEVESEPSLAAVASVIWLHGLGAYPHDFAAAVPNFYSSSTKSVRFIFPFAPEIPVTVNGGYVMPAWYDILEMNIERKVDEQQLTASAAAIHALIEREIARGVSSNNIILAGFSQGGAVVYHAALTYEKPLAGLLVLSSYLAIHANLEINAANQRIPILIQHGSEDDVVDEVLGQKAYRLLADRGCDVTYESYVMEHTLCDEQITSISAWLHARLDRSDHSVRHAGSNV